MINASDRKGPPSQSIDAPRDGETRSTPDSVVESPNKPDSDADDPANTAATRNQSQVKPSDYSKDDGGRPDYGSPERRDEEE